MFDKLIESNAAGAEFKDRSRYFMVSSVVVGILFLTAVVYSLYAGEIGLGDPKFELIELVSPLLETDPEVPEQLEQSNRAASDRSEAPARTTNIARTDEFQFVPDKPSSIPSSIPSRPIGKYIFDPRGSDSGGIGAPTSSLAVRPHGSGSSSRLENTHNVDPGDNVPPPPPREKSISKTMVSEGVINGKARSLPVPVYPTPARAVGAAGEVKVQVTIDEDGKVISARAVSGHPLLRPAAEKSAWGARFSTTYLSRVPVKVTGVIIYNFKKN